MNGHQETVKQLQYEISQLSLTIQLMENAEDIQTLHNQLKEIAEDTNQQISN